MPCGQTSGGDPPSVQGTSGQREYTWLQTNHLSAMSVNSYKVTAGNNGVLNHVGIE